MEKRWITVKEASQYLSLHPKSVYRLLDSGAIPGSRIGGSRRIDLKRLEAIMEVKQKEIESCG